MAIIHHYQNPTSGATTFDDVITPVRLGAVAFVEDGQLGAAASGSVSIDDIDGSDTYLPWQRWYSLEDTCPGALTLTGTVAKDASLLTIVGTGTAFLTELAPGDELVVPGGGGADYLWVASIADDTHATIYLLPKHTASGQTASRAAQQRLASGWTTDYDVDHGDAEPDGGNDAGAGRVWVLPIADVNTALHFRLTRDAAWAKGGAVGAATTVGDRLAAMLATPEMALIVDDGQVDYPTTPCDPGVLTNQYVDAVLQTLATLAGCNFTVAYHEATGHYELIFRKPTTPAMPSPLVLSSYESDRGVAFHLPAVVPHLNGAGVGIFAGIQVVGAAASTYLTHDATADVYEFRDVNVSDSTLKTVAQRTAYGNRHLVDGGSADEKVQCAVVVPEAQMHLIRRWRQVMVKFQELPGWDGVWARILRRDVRHQVAGNGQPTPAFYEVKLVLGPAPTPPVFGPARIVLDRQGISDADAQSIGTFQMTSSCTGDAPCSGYSADPKFGLFDYVFSGGVPVGIECLGSGLIDITCDVQSNFVFDFGSPGGTTVQMLVKVGSTVIASSSVATDSGTGLHSWGPDLTIAASGVPVSNGDVLLIWYAIGVTAPHSGSVPSAGTFRPPYQLVVTGSLSP